MPNICNMFACQDRRKRCLDWGQHAACGSSLLHGSSIRMFRTRLITLFLCVRCDKTVRSLPNCCWCEFCFQVHNDEFFNTSCTRIATAIRNRRPYLRGRKPSGWKPSGRTSQSLHENGTSPSGICSGKATVAAKLLW